MIVDIGEVDGMSRSSSYSGCQGCQLSTCEWSDSFSLLLWYLPRKDSQIFVKQSGMDGTDGLG